MKRLLILVAVVMMASSTIGCRNCGLRPQGPPCATCGQAGASAYGGDGYLSAPSVAPETYVTPGPG